jgi:rod shape-determining protein MreC
MAPSRHRRRGFSRRVQFSLFIGYVIAIVGVVFSLALVLVARFDPNGFSLLRGVALDITAPISSAGRTAVRGIDSMGHEIGAYFRAGSQNNALRDELKTAQRRLIRARALEYENHRLKQIARLIESQPRTVVAARLIGSDLAGHRRFATLSAGAGAGVHTGQPVRSADGLVGRIFETGQFASRVVLLTDGGNTIPVRMARSGVAALAIGRGDGGLDIRALLGGGVPFKRGDVAVTSGTGGVYSPNIPVAVVIRVDGDQALAWPLADPARLDFAIVEPIYQAPVPPREERPSAP